MKVKTVRIAWIIPEPIPRTAISKELTPEEAVKIEAQMDSKGYRHRRVKKPGLNSMHKATMDGTCLTPDGCRVEPDGTCQHGWDSWLKILHVI